MLIFPVQGSKKWETNGDRLAIYRVEKEKKRTKNKTYLEREEDAGDQYRALVVEEEEHWRLTNTGHRYYAGFAVWLLLLLAKKRKKKASLVGLLCIVLFTDAYKPFAQLHYLPAESGS